MIILSFFINKKIYFYLQLWLNYTYLRNFKTSFILNILVIYLFLVNMINSCHCKLIIFKQ